MDTLLTLTVLINIAYVLFLLLYLSRNIFWLRTLAVFGNLSLIPWYYLQESPVWSAMVWSAVYVAINAVQLTILYLERRPINLTEIEQQLYDIGFDSLSPRTYQKVVSLGSFEETARNTPLIKADEYIDKLYVVAEGEVEVTLPDGTTRAIRKGGFIGEQSFITNGKTSADVRVASENASLLTWDKGELRKFLDKYLILSNTFDLIITSDVINKLRRMGDSRSDDGDADGPQQLNRVGAN